MVSRPAPHLVNAGLVFDGPGVLYFVFARRVCCSGRWTERLQRESFQVSVAGAVLSRAASQRENRADHQERTRLQ
jgi:hypothetical protein